MGHSVLHCVRECEGIPLVVAVEQVPEPTVHVGETALGRMLTSGQLLHVGREVVEPVGELGEQSGQT
ncbi:MAG: hypothetical protein ACYCYK_11440 [Candidatus Dormibacteria bacterium]